MKTQILVVLLLAALAALASGAAATPDKPDAPAATVAPTPEPTRAPEASARTVTLSPAVTYAPEPEPTPEPWTAEDVAAIARTLAGECYDDRPADKRKVAETILNRVSAGRWGDTVAVVVTWPGQFRGYWSPSRDVSADDVRVAETALRDWYAGGCAPLSEWLYFGRGADRENVFRAEYRR
jgi:spore germination cell wall hydrolase CwlJ-like protein